MSDIIFTKAKPLSVITASRIGVGRYKLTPSQKAEAINMNRLGEKSQAEIAELFNVDRSTTSNSLVDS